MGEVDFERKVLAKLETIESVVKELQTLNQNINKVVDNMEVLSGQAISKKYSNPEAKG